MPRKSLAILCLITCCNAVSAATVTFSTTGIASGFIAGRQGEVFFADEPATFLVSYNDTGAVPIVQGGTTRFDLASLVLGISAAGLTIIDQEGSISWDQDAIRFHTAHDNGNVSMSIDAAFAWVPTGSTLPTSLEPLRDVPGNAQASRDAGIGFGGPSGQIFAALGPPPPTDRGAVPEPPAGAMLAVGLVAVAVAAITRR